MDEMIKAVAEKAGIGEAQAKMAVETVVNMLKDKLPGPAKMALEAITGGGSSAADAAKGALGSGNRNSPRIARAVFVSTEHG
jgi:hypothetical protein